VATKWEGARVRKRQREGFKGTKGAAAVRSSGLNKVENNIGSWMGTPSYPCHEGRVCLGEGTVIASSYHTSVLALTGSNDIEVPVLLVSLGSFEDGVETMSEVVSVRWWEVFHSTDKFLDNIGAQEKLSLFFSRGPILM
jgi:hypothetical protein